MTFATEPAADPRSAVGASIAVRPLTPTFGAELSGIDLASGLSPAARAEIFALWRRHLVIVIRDQRLSPAELLDFARGFGALDPAPPFDNQRSALEGYPEIAVVSNVEEKGAPIGGLGAGELAWHSDMTYRPEPPGGCVLLAKEIPPAGGNTHFLNMTACLGALPAGLRARIEGLRLIHDSRYTSAGTERVSGDSFATVDHPLVIADPLSGRDCLFLGRRRQSAVVGLGEAEGHELLEALWQPASDDRFVLTHEWRPGDVLLWANVAVMHRRDAFLSTDRRLLHRAQIARFEAAA